MKKTIATFCLLGSTLALSACDTTGKGEVNTQPPYAMERTVSGQSPVAVAAPQVVAPVVAPAERVFQRAQTK